MNETTPYFIVLIVLLVVVTIVTIATTTQAVHLKSTADSLQKQVYGAHFRLTEKNRRDGERNRYRTEQSCGVLRAYALILHATDSYLLNEEFPRATFVEEELRSCGDANMLQNVTVKYDDPVWLLIEKKRSANAFVDDIRSGRVKHIAIKGTPCRVRLPTAPEQEGINAVQPRANPKISSGYHAVFVASVSDSTPQDGDGKCNSLPSRVYSFRMENDDEPWNSLLIRLHQREQRSGMPSTSMHVFGYATV